MSSGQRRALLVAALLALPVSPAATAAVSHPRTRVVVAVIDNGVNPYHDDFAAPAERARPTNLSGYPGKARPLPLSLDDDYDRARAKDKPAWAGVQPQTLYYIPGTKIVGAIWLTDTLLQRGTSVSVSTNPNATDLPIVDNNTHGNRVASVAVGKRNGACKSCDLVIVDTQDFAAGLRWVAAQAWIDVVVNSWSSLANTPLGGAVAGSPMLGDIDVASRQVAAAGKVIVFASGNGISGTGPYARATPDRSTTLTSPATGPPWVLTVGGASPHNDQATPWHNVPVDVVSYGIDWPAADATSTSDQATFFGTSCAAPIVGGVIAQALFDVRGSLQARPTVGALVSLSRATPRPRQGPLRDGVLTAAEMRVAAQAAAARIPFDAAAASQDPTVTPDSSLAAAYVGHGLLRPKDVGTLRHILLGLRAAEPSPSADAAYFDKVNELRAALWGSPP